jgi:hypothetical protein
MRARTQRQERLLRGGARQGRRGPEAAVGTLRVVGEVTQTARSAPHVTHRFMLTPTQFLPPQYFPPYEDRQVVEPPTLRPPGCRRCAGARADSRIRTGTPSPGGMMEEHSSGRGTLGSEEPWQPGRATETASWTTRARLQTPQLRRDRRPTIPCTGRCSRRIRPGRASRDRCSSTVWQLRGPGRRRAAECSSTAPPEPLPALPQRVLPHRALLHRVLVQLVLPQRVHRRAVPARRARHCRRARASLSFLRVSPPLRTKPQPQGRRRPDRQAGDFVAGSAPK